MGKITEGKRTSKWPVQVIIWKGLDREITWKLKGSQTQKQKGLVPGAHLEL